MSPRARIYTLVGLAAAGAAGAVVGITAATANHPKAPCSREFREQVGSVEKWRGLARTRPRSAAVRIQFGIALVCVGDPDGAVRVWREAKRLEPDSRWAVQAQDLLHPDSPRGLPIFQPSFDRPTNAVERLLARGIRFQQQLRPLSAGREFSKAVALAPDDPEAQVAAAVGLYDKDNPTPAFARLGPLTSRFPQAQTVRFHLGILLIWTNRFAEAQRQLRLARSLGPKTRFGTEASTLLKRLENVGTK